MHSGYSCRGAKPERTDVQTHAFGCPRKHEVFEVELTSILVPENLPLQSFQYLLALPLA